MKQCITVSPEMLSFVGTGPLPAAAWPDAPVTLRFSGLGDGEVPIVAFDPTRADAGDQATLLFAVATAACQRIFGFVPQTAGAWHLPADLRALVVAIRDCTAPGDACTTLQLAKSIELLCATFDNFHRNALVPADVDGTLSERDTRAIIAARRLIDERWNEKLTLDAIARVCGLNRVKLTRGFRLMYDATVADTLAEVRLASAGGMLRATDLPVSAIGYRCGYLNNASFTRAFSRRFGVAPTRYRAMAA